MSRLLGTLCCFLAVVVAADAQDIDKLEPIGSIVTFTRTADSVTFDCVDHSQVRVTMLSPDLVRVRAAFTKPLPVRDHSWAIDKRDWITPRWNLSEQTDTVSISTDEIEVVVRRSPLLIEFRDAQTHQSINADQRPMMYDARGAMKQKMFDPDAGTFIAAAKKLGFDEHFYGLCDKAQRLDKRPGGFVNWKSDTPGYLEGRGPIYQTLPFYISLQHEPA